MSLRGRRPSPAINERKPTMFYVLPRTHLLARLVAENRDITIGRLVDDIIAAEAARDGISLGKAS